MLTSALLGVTYLRNFNLRVTVRGLESALSLLYQRKFDEFCNPVGRLLKSSLASLIAKIAALV